MIHHERLSSFFAVLVFAFAAAWLAAPFAAQAQEVQVPFDAEETVDVVDAELRERLGLFPEVEGFVEARLFRSGRGEGVAYELVIRYEGEQERRLRERRALSTAEAETLRQRVSRALAQSRDDDGEATGERERLEEGRYRFLAATTSLGLIDAALLASAPAEDFYDVENVGAAALLGGTAGFFVPLLLTRETKVTTAEATLTGYGGFQGLGHGAQLVQLVAEDETETGTALALTSLLSITEAAAGFYLARRTDMRGGTAETMVLGGLFGASVGSALPILVTGEDGRPSPRERDDGQFVVGEDESVDRLVILGRLLGSGLGTYGGYRLARSADYTQGDARLAGTSGLVGRYLAQAALVLFDRDLTGESRVAAGVGMAGTLGGLALGNRLVRGRDFGEAQGNIAFLGALAGGLAGGAAGIVFDANEETSFTLSALGVLGGFVGTYLTYHGEAQADAGRRDALDLDVGVAPGASLEGGGEGGPLGAFTPAVNVRLGL
jgi:hypothetical protein